MAYSNRDKACLVHGIFYGIQIGLVLLSGIYIFNGWDPRINRYLDLEDDIYIYGDNPGLSFRPRPPKENVERTLISYKGSDRESFAYWVDSLEKFLEVYRKPGLTPGKGSNIHNCDYAKLPAPGQVCDVDIKNWYPCIKENNFNYHKSAPCVFLKLNKIYGWRPAFYNDTETLPEKLPLHLKDHIAKLKISARHELNTIWVSCEGENPADVENIGPVTILPRPGFPGFYYPFENSEGYLSPLVAIHFERPRTGILINVECKAWARNIKHDRASGMGVVHFELMID